MRPIKFVYSINGTALEKVDEIVDLEAIMDDRMSFLPHIEVIISKTSRMQESLMTRILMGLCTLHK
jgi:hypothetical protein